MRLFQRLFARRGFGTDCNGRRRVDSRRFSRRLQFEELEDRKVLDADSFALIGQTDYFNNPSFAAQDGSGYSIAILSSGAEIDNDAFGEDLNFDGAGDRIVYRENFVDPLSEVFDDDGLGTAYASVVAEMAPGADLIILDVFARAAVGH